jgi:hypothetical protein
MTYAKWFSLFFFLNLSLSYSSDKTSGLKKTSYANETADMNLPSGTKGQGLTPEQTEKVLKEIEIIKAKQLESQKILDELDEE